MSMPNPERRMVVLAVEDEPLVRMFVADFMDEAGFKVIEAVSADEAMTLLQARPDVQAVVTDIEMPGSMNGLGLAKVIQERWPGIGVVVTSGRERPGPDDLSEKVAFLAKPYLPDTVINVIRQMATPQVVEATGLVTDLPVKE
jgi:DNA-binding NtrC family response regulator